MAKLPGRYSEFRKEFPAIGRTYDEMSTLTTEGGPLNEKMVQLVRLGMAIGSGHEGAVHSHARRALEAGATPDEVRHAQLCSAGEKCSQRELYRLGAEFADAKYSTPGTRFSTFTDQTVPMLGESRSDRQITLGILRRTAEHLKKRGIHKYLADNREINVDEIYWRSTFGNRYGETNEEEEQLVNDTYKALASRTWSDFRLSRRSTWSTRVIAG